MQSADDYRRLIIACRTGAPIRLGDVATGTGRGKQLARGMGEQSAGDRDERPKYSRAQHH